MRITLLPLALLGLAQAAAADDAAQVARGAEIYGAECASCHGADLAGQPDWQTRLPDGTYPAPPHDASGHTWHHPDALLLDYIRRGGAALIGGGFKSNMPGFADRLTEDEILAVLAFIKSTWPAEVRATQERRGGG
jgi:mono/diheme cytochrome c family protein